MKGFKRVVAFVLTFAVIFNILSGSNITSNAVKLSAKTVTANVGDTIKITLKGAKKKVKWSLSNKKAKIKTKSKKKCVVVAKKPGNVKLIAKVGKKKYITRITIVSESTNVTEDIPSSESDSTEIKATENDEVYKNTEALDSGTTQVPSAGTTQNPASGTTEAISDGTTQMPGAGTTEKPNQNTEATTTTVPPTTAAGSTTEVIVNGTTESAGDYSLEKAHKGQATFYDRASKGAANLDSYEEKYLTTAMYEGDYLNNMAGAYLEVTDKDGDVVKVMVTDILPYAEGKSGNLDLSRKAFKSIEPEVTGRMNISWRIIALPTDEPISYVFKPTSTKWWAEVQVRNHRYPIKTLEYLDKSTGKYKSLERKSYNYFAAPNGMGEGPYTFRVTDIYGRQLIDENIAINTNEKEIKGKANFPYISVAY